MVGFNRVTLPNGQVVITTANNSGSTPNIDIWGNPINSISSPNLNQLGRYETNFLKTEELLRIKENPNKAKELKKSANSTLRNRGRATIRNSVLTIVGGVAVGVNQSTVSQILVQKGIPKNPNQITSKDYKTLGIKINKPVDNSNNNSNSLNTNNSNNNLNSNLKLSPPNNIRLSPPNVNPKVNNQEKFNQWQSKNNKGNGYINLSAKKSSNPLSNSQAKKNLNQSLNRKLAIKETIKKLFIELKINLSKSKPQSGFIYLSSSTKPKQNNKKVESFFSNRIFRQPNLTSPNKNYINFRNGFVNFFTGINTAWSQRFNFDLTLRNKSNNTSQFEGGKPVIIEKDLVKKLEGTVLTKRAEVRITYKWRAIYTAYNHKNYHPPIFVEGIFTTGFFQDANKPITQKDILQKISINTVVSRSWVSIGGLPGFPEGLARGTVINSTNFPRYWSTPGQSFVSGTISNWTIDKIEQVDPPIKSTAESNKRFSFRFNYPNFLNPQLFLPQVFLPQLFLPNSKPMDNPIINNPNPLKTTPKAFSVGKTPIYPRNQSNDLKVYDTKIVNDPAKNPQYRTDPSSGKLAPVQKPITQAAPATKCEKQAVCSGRANQSVGPLPPSGGCTWSVDRAGVLATQTTISSGVTGLSGLITALGANIAAITAILTAIANTQLVAIQATLGTIGTAIAALTTQLTAIQAEITANFTALTLQISKFAKSIYLDKVLNFLNFILSLHNALQLSRSLGSSIGELIDSVASRFSLKNEDGEPFSLSEFLGDSIQNTLKTIVGAELYSGVTRAWAKTSAIWTSAGNILDLTRSMLEGVQTLVEIGAQSTGKIGNALKKSGVIMENSFDWFDEKINARTGWFKKFSNFIEDVQQPVDTIAEISETIGEIGENWEELKSEKEKITTQLEKNIETKTREETTNKTNSQSPEIDNSDLTISEPN